MPLVSPNALFSAFVCAVYFAKRRTGRYFSRSTGTANNLSSPNAMETNSPSEDVTLQKAPKYKSVKRGDPAASMKEVMGCCS